MLAYGARLGVLRSAGSSAIVFERIAMSYRHGTPSSVLLPFAISLFRVDAAIRMLEIRLVSTAFWTD